MSNNTRRPYSTNRFSRELDEIHARREAESAGNKNRKSSGPGGNSGSAGRSRKKMTYRTGTSTVRKRAGSSAGRRPAANTAVRRARPAANGPRRRPGTTSNTARRRARRRAGRRTGQSSLRRYLGCFGSIVLLVLVCFCFVHFYQKYQVYMEQKKAGEVRQEILAEAKHMAAGYDYDGAMARLQTIKGYKTDDQVQKVLRKYKSAKDKLVSFTADDVTHIFYHTLVRDTSLAFDCAPSIAEGFKKWMTTIEEFRKITQTMYDRGYVLCSIYDFFEETYDENGVPHFKEKAVWLPEGKKPFILSLDDLSYYHTYTGHGMATRLVLDEEGKITCEYEKKDGTVETGSFDCVPLLNEFMEEHPDGAYHDARGIIALTGYNGIFGYRTDESYVTRKNLDADKVKWLEDHPDYDRKVEIHGAELVTEELKREGWTFASHTWGHIRVGKASLAKIKVDTEKWLKNVAPIIGKTECIIFAHGQDLSSTDEYDTENNKKYKYLASQGFHIFLNVDSHQKTMDVHDLYVHGGRRNLDGYRLWNDAHGISNWTSDLFDASDILDSRRTDMPDQNE
ncbi:MAG: polysaccharide deacetylase [Eubacterium sp.]|nr:polysaccharide deacetylase [Eubacterium sp.]